MREESCVTPSELNAADQEVDISASDSEEGEVTEEMGFGFKLLRKNRKRTAPRAPKNNASRPGLEQIEAFVAEEPLVSEIVAAEMGQEEEKVLGRFEDWVGKVVVRDGAKIQAKPISNSSDYLVPSQNPNVPNHSDALPTQIAPQVHPP